MNTFLIVVFVIIFLIVILGIIYINLYNKFSESMIRIDEAEARIDNNLRDKYDLIQKGSSLIRSKIELDEDAFRDLIKLKSMKLSNFELDRMLVKIMNEYSTIYDNNQKLKENEEINKVSKQIEIIDAELVTLRSYYNANVINYNKMIKKIPTSFIAKIKNYKEKLFYDLKDMSDEDHEDFKL